MYRKKVTLHTHTHRAMAAGSRKAFLVAPADESFDGLGLVTIQHAAASW